MLEFALGTREFREVLGLKGGIMGTYSCVERGNFEENGLKFALGTR